MPDENQIQVMQQKIQVLSALLSRAQLMGYLGSSYDGNRDLYEALGYDLSLTYDKYATIYSRNAMAAAVINRPVDATWRGELSLIEPGDAEETEFEKAWTELNTTIGLKSRFARLDKLIGLGEYGVLFLGLDDGADFQSPVTGSSHKLLYVKPLGKGSAQVRTWDMDARSPRYGMPLFYSISIKEKEGNTSVALTAHHSRIIHVADGMLESETEGTPRLQSVYNNLQNLEKIEGGSAEMFWRGARPGYHGKVDKDFQLTTELTDALQEKIDEYEHKLRRILMTEGVNLETLATQVSDPAAHVDVQVQMISAAVGIPKRILVGSERGELSSSQDDDNWNKTIQSRREEFAEPQIIRPFVTRCIEYGILPTPKDAWVTRWTDLWAPSDKEQADVGQVRAEALSKYASSPLAQEILPPEAFFEFMLGFDDGQIELVNEMRDQGIEEEEAELKALDEETPAETEEEISIADEDVPADAAAEEEEIE